MSKVDSMTIGTEEDGLFERREPERHIMTTTSIAETDFGVSLAMLWQRHRQTNLDRISLLEETTADVLRAIATEDEVATGGRTAHMLAGSLGTFGFDAGSRAALEAESLLREPVIDGRLLAEAVTLLRSSVEDADDRPLEVTVPISQGGMPGSQVGFRIVSSDSDLISRLTVEASTTGLAVTSGPELPPRAGGADTPAMIVVDVANSSWTGTGMVEAVAELAHTTLVVVLTDSDGFADRMDFAGAGAVGVVPRSQGARQTVAFLAELLAWRKPALTTVLAMVPSAALRQQLHTAVSGRHCLLDIRIGAPDFWKALEEHGADLVVIGCAGSKVSGLDLCRVIRAHPRWRRLPVVIIGGGGASGLDDAMAVGADDYLEAGLSSHDLGVRLSNHLDRERLAQARSDVDPLTGTRNRAAIEHALDRYCRLARRHGAPFALSLIVADQIEKVREVEGNAVADIILRRLGERLIDRFRGEDIVGRWTHDGFAVGMYGTGGEQACERINGVLASFVAEEVHTTSGKLAHHTFSAGVASTPADGSTLASLERTAESALRRAKKAQNCVVGASERSIEHPNTVDVVLVEDDDSVAEVVEHALGLRHYEFVRFSDGAEAARAMGEGHIKGHVLLLDVGLPGLDGFGVLKVLGHQGILADTRVIMLTARSSEAEMLRALGLGAAELITKPFSIPMLMGRLDRTPVGVDA
jgi:diguanylate cyclase (GGDEF)-like protein